MATEKTEKTGKAAGWDDDPACRGAMRFGWTAVAFFLLLGLALELLHLIKAPFYVEATLRRELWTLAHAHGTLLGILTVVFALTAHRLIVGDEGRRRASFLIRTAAVLVPAGFFLGGVGNAEGDPSLAIVLVPIGALLAFAAVATLARGAWKTRGRVAGPDAPPNAPSKTRKKRRS